MKILFLNYEYPPLGGGAGVATEGLLQAWAKEGAHEVHLVTSSVGDHIEHERVGGEVYVHRLPIGKDQKQLHSQSPRDIIVYSFKTLIFLATFIGKQEKSFDVTLAFFTIPSGFIAWLIQIFTGIPFVVSLRGADVPGFSEKYDTFYRFAKPLVRFLWKKSVAVIPNSPGLRELARNTDSKREMEIVMNGVDAEKFTPREGQQIREVFVFLSTSRLTPRKRIDTLIRAFAVAAKGSKREMELHIIGEGEELSRLRELAQSLGVKERVKFMGRVPHEHLPVVYQQADVFVLPSKNEGMSNSVLEALSSGLPLLVSGTGGMRELVADGENGFFIDPDQTSDFAEKMLRLIEDDDLRLMMGKKSRERSAGHSWIKVAQSFAKVLEQATRKK